MPPAIFDRFKERFGVEILDGIGSTETLHMFISNRPGAIRPGASGQLVAGYEARILDDDRHEVPRGEIGNLHIKGDSICAAYWNQHQKTKDTIEVENALLAHAAVQECAVVGHDDGDGLSKPLAFVVTRDGVSPGAELARELQGFVRAQLAEYKRPRWVEFVPELPKTATGKIQRFKLRR